ncbi:G-type lectin S-receptor-like serine/threonine-protein kinase RLK1 [Citrus sinensis]|uniref:G-type lectin S-receptor-like serine/threonine-protein kinase RLK1 n=1 Tax=Citrus sinensis TaxID=2711 RepID=A0ACB8MVQ5_CITSI|nr:G-type lectin S-receptor-like serine/threonine-protein kinase RLK1 [Citrus sinensis]KAH9789470.1 G-type lectin S-receptor-like serine/threonine-protein kinase RLK1 [Citrus sinensis]
MACHLLSLLFLLLLPCLTAAQSNGTISIGQQLTAAESTEPWLSPSKDFALGFHQLDNDPGPGGSKLRLTANGGLVLEDPEAREIWKSEISTGEAAFGVLYDTGNFLIVNTNSERLWQTFDHPTDTLLPTQTMERGGVVSSRRKETDFSRGRFQFRLLEDGNAVLNTINLESGFAYDAFFWSNTFDVNRSNAGYRVVFNESGQLYVLRENKQIVSLTPETVSAKENYLRATLNFDGVFIFYSHPKNNSTGDAIWSVSDVLPENICINNDIRKGLGSGICGFNSICSISGAKRPICQCPKGFSLLDPDDVYGSCKPDFILGCEEDGKKSGEDLYYIEELRNTDWPTSDYEQISPYGKDECVSSCLKDCQCSAAVLRDDTCWKKKLPLSYGKTDRDETGTTFIKIRKVPSGGKKKVDVLIPVVSVLFGSSALINLLLVSACCLGFLVVNRKKFMRPHQEEQGVSYMNLRCFTYKELVEVTRGFKEELGRGAFGTVYKGFVNMGSSDQVAVKKLNRVFQDSEKEFKAEVNGIGQTHHKNLVRLLGYCDEGRNRLLVYEFMSNGALASFLFGDSKPNWKLRTEIVMGIARGLFYLHEECCTQIIHCDIKPQNILLDDYYNARISDFGLEKLLTLDQSHTNTAIRGTKGYVAPEWFRNMPITVKERTLGALVENDLEAMDDMTVLQRFVMVAIWCIQEDPSHRPTMRRVTQMLEGVVEHGGIRIDFAFNHLERIAQARHEIEDESYKDNALYKYHEEKAKLTLQIDELLAKAEKQKNEIHDFITTKYDEGLIRTTLLLSEAMELIANNAGASLL